MKLVFAFGVITRLRKNGPLLIIINDFDAIPAEDYFRVQKKL